MSGIIRSGGSGSTPVEFFNGNLTLAQLQAGHPIVTVPAGQTAVVRDIVTSHPVVQDLTLSVGGTRVASVNAGGALSGEELVPSGGSMNVLSDVRAIWNRMAVFSNTRMHQLAFPTQFGVGSPVVPTVTETTISPTLGGDAMFACIAANGDFYHWNSSAQVIHRRAGGVNGAQTVVLSSVSVPPVYDGERFIYSVTSGSNFQRIDTQSPGASATSINFNPVITNYDNTIARFAVIDGFAVIRPSSTGSSLFWTANLTTGVTASIPLHIDSSGQRFPLGVGRRADGDYVIAAGGSSTPTRIINIGPILAAPSSKVTVSISNSFTNSVGNSLVRSPDRSKIIGFADANSFMIVDLEAYSLGSSFASGAAGLSATPTVGSCIPAVDAAAASVDFGTARIRATGLMFS